MINKKDPKERMLETAYRLFYAQGYNATGINQILEEAGVAKASLYQHFGSKEELGIEYIRKVRVDWFAALNEFISEKKEPRDKIFAAFDFLEQNMIKNNFQGCRFLNLLTDVDHASKEIRKEIVDHKTKLRRFFKSLVKQHPSPACMSTMEDVVYLLFESAIIEAKLYKDAWPITTAKHAVRNLFKARH